MTGLSQEAIGAVLVVLSAFYLGGLAGLYVAWSQPARMDCWAALQVDRLQRVLNKAEGVNTDDMAAGGARSALDLGRS